MLRKSKIKLIDVKVKNNINFPNDLKADLDPELYTIANKVVIPLLKDLIRTSTAVDGSPLPPLEPSTIKKKGSSKQLIDTGLLLDSFMAYRGQKGSVIVRIKSGRRDVAEALQVDGVGKNNKRFFFFGLTDGMEKDCLDMMKDLLGKILKNG